MKYDDGGRQEAFDPADYPALREFFAGYLHQDFREEYDSAADAVQGFVSEASGDEILQVKDEWQRLRAALANQKWDAIQAAFEQLGASWRPETEAEVRRVDVILLRAEA